MKKLIFYLRKLLYIGFANDLTVDSLARVQVTNLVTILVILSNFQYSLFFCYFGVPSYLFINILNCTIALFLLYVFFLNHNGKYHVAKVFLVSIMPIPVSVCTFFFLGPEPGIHYFYLIFAIVPFVIFSFDHKYLILVYFFANVAFYLYFEFIAVSYQFNFNSNHSRIFCINFFRLTSVISCLTLVALFMMYFLQNVYKNQELLIRTNFHKDRIFSILAHDLKGPMGSMGTFLDILIEDMPKKEEMQKALIELRKHSTQSYLILENLLDWVRVDSGKLIYTPDLYNVFDMVNDVLELLQIQIKDKKISIQLTIPNDQMSYCDDRMTATILRNLISNAIKYSQKFGEIRIGSERKGGFLEVFVQDYGIGISMNLLKQIQNKEKFTSHYGTLGEKGTGLGLLVTTNLIEDQGGSYKIVSEIGKGTIFSFSLPLSG